MSELSETITDVSDCSDISSLTNNDLSINGVELQEEEFRLKKKHTKEERAVLRKLKEEQITQEKKEKALKSMNYLLGASQKYSKYFLQKFQTYNFEEK